MSRPELALIHGWGIGREAWESLVGPLGERVAPRFIDLPGYGGAPAESDFARAAQRIAEALPAGAALCGWSLGGLLALRVARLAPQRVGQLILVGATPRFVQAADWPAAQAPALLDGFRAAVAEDARPALQRFVALFNQGDARARPIGRELLRALSASPLPDGATLDAGLDWLRDVDLRAELAAIAQPTLVVHGENDPLMPLAAARALAAGIPGARLECFAGAAHAPFLNDPERFARLLGDFLHVPHAA